MAKGKSWPKIGRLCKGDKGTYIQLNPNVEILVDGVKISLNEKKYVNCEDPRNTVKALLERGIIQEEEANTRLESLNSREWYRYDLVAPPKRD
jgi:hypothetical protein